jgi:hypothetical protein
MTLQIFLVVLFAFGPVSAQVNLKLVTDEAEAVLNVLAKHRANQSIDEADWQRIFQSEGYVRLKKRETSMQRSFENTDFKTFVLSDAMTQRGPALQEALARWKSADIDGAARMALAYLPKDAQIRAKIYPVIKPRENTFVFEVQQDPAIFFYLNPAESREKFMNTLAHELHHIGYGGSCPLKNTAEEIKKLPANVRIALQLVGAFGEGFAMLAAAGGPDVHPHAVSGAEERARWDKDVANFDADLKKVEQFLLDVVGGKLSEDEIQKIGFSFFGVQGPWYTVGWKMSVVIEKSFGRARLIEAFCDPRKLLATYNEAAAIYNRKSSRPVVPWSKSLVDALR